MKRISVYFVIFLSVSFIPAYFTLATTPMLSKGFGDNSRKVVKGQQLAKLILQRDSNNSDVVLFAEDLESLSTWLSDDAELTDYLLTLSNYGVSITFSHKLVPNIPLYVNAVCFYSNYKERLSGEGCTVGKLAMSNDRVEKLFRWVAKYYAEKLLMGIVNNARLNSAEGSLSVAEIGTSEDNVNALQISLRTERLQESAPVVSPLPYDDKTLLQKHHLELIGGFKIPRVKHKGMPYSAMYVDNLPGTKRWVLGHTSGFVAELIEPGRLGSGAQETWPELIELRRARVLHNVNRLGPSGVLYLDNDNVLTSGRKSYRSGFEPQWLSKVNLVSGAETRFRLVSGTNKESDNFHLMQALGGGFMRITDEKWSQENLGGAEFLLGRGGYDVLGSPLGPALALWSGENDKPKFLLDFPNQHPARRDPYYTYPAIDPNTYKKAKLPIWKMPVGQNGFWQAGNVGGIAFIEHPTVKGVVVTHNYGRGVHDYRSQNESGSGEYFMVADPTIFYSPQSSGNRGNHRGEPANQQYPRGLFVRGGQVYEPSHLQKANVGKVKPYDAKSTTFDWPKQGLSWSNQPKSYTKLGSILWDNPRQILWLVQGNFKQTYLVAYRINDDAEPQGNVVDIPKGWLESFEKAKLFESELQRSLIFSQADSTPLELNNPSLE